MKKLLLLILTITSLTSLANANEFKAKIRNVSQFQDQVFVTVDTGGTICNFEVVGKCSPLYVSFKLSDNLVTTDILNLLENAKANKIDVNVVTDVDEQRNDRIISVIEIAK